MSLLKLLIIGHGSQSKAWSTNLKKSSTSVTIGLRSGSSSIAKVKKAGLPVIELDNVKDISDFDAIILLTPDNSHLEILQLLPKIHRGAQRIIYAHGYSLEKDRLHHKFPNFSHLLLAPKAIASEVILLHQQNKPIPAAFSLEHSINPVSDLEIIQEVANSVGMTGRLIQTTFKEEMSCDLFSEQSILCSVLPHVIKLSYDTLVKNGVSQELAFLECCLESKYILNTLLKVGFPKFFDIISPNALIGANKATSKLFDEKFHQKFNNLFTDIESGKFYQEIESADIDTLRKKMVSLYSEGDIEVTRNTLQEYLN